MGKKVNKVIRFGFFKCKFCCNIDDVTRKIKKLQKSNKKEDRTKIETLTHLKHELKNPSDLFGKIVDSIKNCEIDSVYLIQGKLIEIDRETFISKDDHIFFQMVHDRDDAISKKKLDMKRESIHLDDDEYISEFTGVIFQKNTNMFMVQYNKYAVSANQIGEFFSRCLEGYFQSKLEPKEKYTHFPAKIELDPVVDSNRLKNVKKNKCIEKMIIKADLSSYENIKKLSEANKPIFNMGNAISSVNGYEFTVTITANKIREGRQIEYESISQEFCSNLYDAYNNVGDRDNIDVTMQFRNENDVREVLTWSSPLKECYINFSIESRKEIKFEEIYEKMVLQL